MGQNRAAKRRARKARRQRKRAIAVGAAGYCTDCSKRTWLTFEEAGVAVEKIKTEPGMRKPDLLNPYCCPAGNGWHIGHNYKLKWISLCIGERK